MSEFFTFAGQHPWITFFLVMCLAHMPVAVIQALKNQPDE